MRLDQTYDPLDVEEQWYAFWVERGFFKADEHSEKPPYAIMIPPPNVTGSLHMGHALFVTLQDILIRWKRMSGFEALWLPGTDHAGIATQVVVERLLREEGLTRHDLGREAFLERVWQWKEKSGGRIVEQLKRMGASCDWERERFTMDEGLSHAVRVIFKRMYEDGLIYRGDRMVNWDPATQTVLSDLEVLTTKEGERGKFWYLRYPLADGSGHITVGTTRPETMLGDSAVAVHPDDERYTDLIGKMVRLPLVDREVPIIADTILPDPEKGTGAVKVTPAHDPNDYACGERHDLALIQVIGLDATILAEHAPEEFAGLDRYEARKLVVQRFEELGLLERTEDITYFPGRSERSNVVVEPLVMKQWFVRGEPLAKPAVEAVEDGRIRIVPPVWKKTYDHFMLNPRDWCISRQLWWGHQIPAWYGPDGAIFVDEDEAGALAQAEAHYGEATELNRDPDVLDTWFSSGLWPFSTLGWPDETKALEKFYPGAVLETGSDILFFWVARMIMMGMYAMKEIPFKDVFLHAMVRDEAGRKMSKVKGNVIDPLHMIYGAAVEELDEKMHRELIKKVKKDSLTITRDDEEVPGISSQGADALRFTLSILAAQARDINLNISRMEGYRAFLNKLWNASKFVLMNLDGFAPAAYSSYTSDWTVEGAASPIPGWAHTSEADRWILSKLNHTVAVVQEALEAYRFNEAAQQMYDFVWHELCDWYIEFTKPTLYDDSEENAPRRLATQATLSYTLDVVLRLMHPFTPFISEDIWQAMPRAEDAPEALIVAPWPEALSNLDALVGDAPEDIALAIEVVNAVRSIRGETGVKPNVTIDETFIIAESAEQADALARISGYVSRLSRIDTMTILASADEAPEKPSATAVALGAELRIPLAGLIDIEEETQRLTRELARVAEDITFVSRKLNNEKFVSRAPEAIVQRERDKLAAYLQERDALEASMAELQKLAE